MKKLVRVLFESTLFNSTASVLYYIFIWTTLMLWVVYAIDYALALKGKKSMTSNFVGKDLKDIRCNNLAPLYRGVSNISVLNIVIGEALRRLSEYMGWEFSILLPLTCIAVSGVAYIINLGVFCRQYNVLPKFIVRFIHK